MARSNDVVVVAPQSKGYDMVNRQRETHAHNSLAQGRTVTGLASGLAATGSPGANLGTGMNADKYTPGIELV